MQRNKTKPVIALLLCLAPAWLRAEAPDPLAEIEKHYADFDFVCVVELVEKDAAPGKIARWNRRLVRIFKGEFRPELARRVLERAAGGKAKGELRLVALKHSGSGLSSPIRTDAEGVPTVTVFSKPEGKFIQIQIPGLTPSDTSP